MRDEPTQAEFQDRLDGPDLDEEIATRPIQDIIMDIRRDLGLEELLGNHLWQPRTPRDIEALRKRAATPRPPAPTTHPLTAPTPEPPNPTTPPETPNGNAKNSSTSPNSYPADNGSSRMPFGIPPTSAPARVPQHKSPNIP